tara:strand:+ start:1808 stop:1960 length:153 start_codon:yes stop_codon:yes gene_type:complete
LKLSLEELAFIKEAVSNSTIKGEAAKFVGNVLDKLEKEFTSLYDKENKNK